MSATVADRADWLAQRRKSLGASDVPAILGISPFASAFSIAAQKLGLVPLDDDVDDDDPREFGRRAERMIAEWFTDRTGLYVAGEQMVCRHPGESWLTCTLDGLVVESPNSSIDNALGVCEIKTTSARRWDSIPEHVQAQVQTQMLITGFGRAWIPTLHGRRLVIYELAADPADQAFILKRAAEFWHRYIEAGELPPTDGHQATLDALAAVYPTSSPGAVSLDDIALVVVAWRAAKDDERQAKAERDEAEAAIKAALGDADEGTIDGQRVVSWRSQTRRSLDTKALSAAEPDLAKRFARETSFRVLRSHEPKEAKS